MARLPLNGEFRIRIGHSVYLLLPADRVKGKKMFFGRKNLGNAKETRYFTAEFFQNFWNTEKDFGD